MEIFVFKLQKDCIKLRKMTFAYSSIEKITIPSNITRIFDFEFSNCANFRNVQINESSDFQLIDKRSITNCSIESIFIPPNYEIC